MNTISANEIFYWNSISYGNAIRIDKKKLKIVLSVIFFVLPLMNWMIPIILKVIKKGKIIIRYESKSDLFRFWRWFK